MKTVTLEEAMKCPKCSLTGEEIGRSKRRGHSLVYIRCGNERCSWFDSNWLVQQLDDGTVPMRDENDRPEPKQFPTVEGMTIARAERIIESDFIGDDTKPPSYKKS